MTALSGGEKLSGSVGPQPQLPSKLFPSKLRGPWASRATWKQCKIKEGRVAIPNVRAPIAQARNREKGKGEIPFLSYLHIYLFI